MTDPASDCAAHGGAIWNFVMLEAPHNGTLLLLLIQQDEDHNCGFDDAEITRTMGFNNKDNDEIDEWKFPGWSWTHDCIIEQGHGVPVAWALMPALPAALATRTSESGT